MLVLGILMLCCAGGVFIKNPVMQAEMIGLPIASPTPDVFDRSIVTREVLLPGQTWYAIQTGVFSTREAADEKANAYVDRGAPGVVVEDGGKWRVFIASYGREEDAAAVRQRLGEQQRVETYLYHWSRPELHLRLSGMAGQLDVVEAGLTLLSGAAGILRDTAMLLDASQVSVMEAIQAVTDLDAQISLWEKTAADRFGHQTPILVSQMLQITEGWKTRQAAIRKAGDSAGALSAEIKRQGMQLYDDMIRLQSQLSGE